mgnify:CR=1 FL=1
MNIRTTNINNKGLANVVTIVSTSKPIPIKPSTQTSQGGREVITPSGTVVMNLSKPFKKK